ncbi:MAG: HAD family phosphatase [Chitinophagales bacterium]|nr:HAD family phosphatase [Chitinophagales bacterium]MDW8419845.1 HAD family phosphatase [Chitinophagales bacterium]
MPAYQYLIFDLGDVIIDIDYHATINAFQQLSRVDFSEVVSYARQHPVFDRLERGEISAQEFRSELRRFLHPQVTDEQIDAAWNAILVGFPPEKLQLVENLKQNYEVYALSNINEIHTAQLDRVARERFGKERFSDFFHHAFYSHEVGHRKPEPEIFRYVTEVKNIAPERTFFVDDKKENVEAASAAGWHAYQLTDRNALFHLLQTHKIIS